MTGIVETTEAHTLLDELTTMIGREDPYPRYARLREISPLIRAKDGAIVVTRYADCFQVTRDSRLGHVSTDMIALLLPDWEDHPALRQLFTSMLLRNPPDHTRLRRLVSGTFTARRVAALRPAIAAMVDDLLNDLDGCDGVVDFVDAFAFPLPVNVIGELLGVPAPDRARFKGLVRDWTRVVDMFDEDVLRVADPAAATIRDYLAGLAAQRRRRPGDDLLSALVAAEDAGDQLTEDELLTTAALLFAAGFETTTNLLANGLVALVRHPDQLTHLRDRPEPAVEELLRYDSPVQILNRLVLAPLEIAGVEIAAGERIVAYIGAGNHDPARFADPERMILDRGDNAPLSFGGGIHYCLGAPLARLEAQVALPALVGRFPGLALDGAPERRDSLSIRGFTSLPITTG
jgi:cytochrome P450